MPAGAAAKAAALVRMTGGFRAALLRCGAVLLCLGVVMSGISPALASKPLPNILILRQDGLRLHGLDGYCPDPATLRQKDGAVVVMFGRCSDGHKVKPAVFSVTFGRPGSAAVMMADGKAMADFFASEAGRKSLSPHGRAEDVQVTQALSLRDLFLFQVHDRQEGRYWRGMASVAGRTLSVKANGPELSDAEGRKLVEGMLGALMQTNRSVKAPDQVPE